MKTHILGMNSRLFKACKELDNHSVIKYKRSEYLSWINNTQRLAEKLDPNIEHHFIIFSSITNPNEEIEKVLNVNYELPKAILSLSNKFRIKVVTFGTILEESKIINNYVSSKKKYSTFLLEIDKKNFLHFRLHTLYGKGLPIEHMFLGQIYKSIKENCQFRMSSGNQVRQYHHYEDIAKIITSYIINGEEGIQQLTSNESIKIGTIARLLFKRYSTLDLLKFDKELDLNTEIIEPFINNYDLNKFTFRASLEGIENYFKEIL